MNYVQRVLYGWYRGLFRFVFGLNPNVHIHTPLHVHIGRNVHIGFGACLVARNHRLSHPEQCLDWDDVIIEDDCWIGANAIILPGVHLGPHMVVGAGSVVTKSFPKGYGVLVGNPAKMIKKIEVS